MRIKTDEKILNSIKQRLIRKLNLSPEYINRMNSGSVALYIEDIFDKKQALMQSRDNEIVIDKKFVDFDSKGNVIGLKAHLSKLTTSQLGHELLHAASRNNGNNGIKRPKGPDNTGLNEGITQMFTEDAFGYVVSPFSDGYTDYKKVAKIMRLCLGNQVFRNSYFDHTNDLEIATNRLARSRKFYAELNQALTDLYYLKKSIKKNVLTQFQVNIMYKVYNERLKSCFANIITYLVVPTVNSLKTEAEKKRFINQVLSEVSDNREVFAEVTRLLHRELFMSSKELEKEKEKIKLYDQRASAKRRIVDLASTNSLKEEMFIIDKNGNIQYKKDDGTTIDITKDESVCTIVYDFFFDKYFSYDMEKYVDEHIKSPIKFSKDLSPKVRMIFFARFKQVCAAKHIRVLTSFSEVATSDELSVSMVYEKMTLKCLRRLVERYEYKPQDENNSRGKYVVEDRITKKKITDVDIVQSVRFAYIWLSTGKNSFPGESIRGFEDAFGETNEELYNEIVKLLTNNIKTKGEMDIPSLYAYANKHKDKRCYRIVQAILASPESYEDVYRFISSRIKDKSLQAQKEKSTMEENHSGYNASMIDLAVDEIFAKPKR